MKIKVVLCAVLLIAVMFAGCSQEPSQSPSRLIGTWVTYLHLGEESQELYYTFDADGIYSGEYIYGSDAPIPFSGVYTVADNEITVTMNYSKLYREGTVVVYTYYFDSEGKLTVRASWMRTMTFTKINRE